METTRDIIYDEEKHIYKIFNTSFSYRITFYKRIKIGNKIYYAIGRGFNGKEEFYKIEDIRVIIDKYLKYFKYDFKYDEQLNRLYHGKNHNNQIYLDLLDLVEIKETGLTHQIDKIEHINSLEFYIELGVNVLNAKEYLETAYECISNVELHSVKKIKLNEYIADGYKTNLYKEIKNKSILDLIGIIGNMSDVVYHNKTRIYEKIIKDNIRDKLMIHIAELVVTEHKLLGNIYRKEYSIVRESN